MKILTDVNLDNESPNILTVGDAGSGKSTLVERALHKVDYPMAQDIYLIDVHSTGNYDHLSYIRKASETFLVPLTKELRYRQERLKKGEYVGNPIYIIVDGFQALEDKSVIHTFLTEAEGTNMFLWAITSGSCPISHEVIEQFHTLMVLKCSKQMSVETLGIPDAGMTKEDFGNVWIANDKLGIRHYRETLHCS